MERRKHSSSLVEIGRVGGLVRGYSGGDISRLLDVGSDKDPIAALGFVGKFPGLSVAHYKDKKVVTKVPERRMFPGVELINTFEELSMRDPYDVVTAIYTLHEFEKPERSLENALGKLKNGGLFVLKDYDLSWFSAFSEEKGWDDMEKRDYFSRHIFTDSNEQSVLGLADGKPLSDKRIKNNIRKGVEVEPKCVRQHTKFGMDDYLGMFSKLGLKELLLESHEISIPSGDFSKTFLYIGRMVGGS